MASVPTLTNAESVSHTNKAFLRPPPGDSSPTSITEDKMDVTALDHPPRPCRQPQAHVRSGGRWRGTRAHRCTCKVLQEVTVCLSAVPGAPSLCVAALVLCQGVWAGVPPGSHTLQLDSPLRPQMRQCRAGRVLTEGHLQPNELPSQLEGRPVITHAHLPST